MTILEAVANEINRIDPTLTIGEVLFAGRMPETPDRCVAVFQHQGQGQVETMGDGEVLDQPRIQVLCRASRDDYPTAQADANTIHAGLDAYAVLWSGVSILRCIPISTPSSLGPDPVERPMLSVRFEVVLPR